MKRQAAGYLVVLGCAMLAAGGCAKKEMVKQDESIAPLATSAVNAPAKTDTTKTMPVKEQHVKQEPLKETSAGTEQLKEALNSIYFDFDRYNLSEASRATLVNDANLLRKDSSEKIKIEGNCDERGSDEYNLALGEKRARAAMQYLVTMGIPADHLTVISYGKEKPADPGHDEAAWAKNRRDDFVVLSK
ncbi:MAG TPA: peptidoglycan-associated lipoprotein Pal [Geobacteraceae bacterium]|nr:peptidoglycan-associated lipoprotein Pal [Geobacteraceae bacterium]